MAPKVIMLFPLLCKYALPPENRMWLSCQGNTNVRPHRNERAKLRIADYLRISTEPIPNPEYMGLHSAIDSILNSLAIDFLGLRGEIGLVWRAW